MRVVVSLIVWYTMTVLVLVIVSSVLTSDWGEDGLADDWGEGPLTLTSAFASVTLKRSLLVTS